MLHDHDIHIDFSIAEIGARPIDEQTEPFHILPAIFPGTKIHAFEVDAALCDRLNAKAPAGVEYHGVALAGVAGKRRLYQTAHPMCASLYEPQAFWPDTFHNLDVMRTTSIAEVEVTTLDAFARAQDIPRIDIAKLDVQGAELEILQGGEEVLASAAAIITEAEFVPLYKDQPLFADIDRYLRGRGFMLHKLLGIGGRGARPLVVGKDVNRPVQWMWTDALYVRNFLEVAALPSATLHRLAVVFDLYDSPDMAHWVLSELDRRNGTQLAAAFVRQFSR